MKHGQTTLDPCHRALFREPRNLNRPSKILKLCSGFMIHVVSIDKWWQVALFIIVSSCLLGTWLRRRLYKSIKSTSPGVCAECGTPSIRDHPLGKKCGCRNMRGDRLLRWKELSWEAQVICCFMSFQCNYSHSYKEEVAVVLSSAQLAFGQG